MYVFNHDMRLFDDKRASYGTGKMLKTNRCPFLNVYKTASCDIKRFALSFRLLDVVHKKMYFE